METETVIYTIRHGRTDYNAEKRYAGSIDIPLSKKGIQECRTAAGQLAQYHFDLVVTSTLQRSIATAQIVSPNGTPIVQTPLCNERNFGVMEGSTWDEVCKMDPPILMINVGDDLHTVNPAGGEPFEDVWERAKQFRRFLFRNYNGKSVLVISHGVFLQMFHGLVRGISCIESLADFPANLQLTRFAFSGKRLVQENVNRLNTSGEEARF